MSENSLLYRNIFFIHKNNHPVCILSWIHRPFDDRQWRKLRQCHCDCSTMNSCGRFSLGINTLIKPEMTFENFVPPFNQTDSIGCISRAYH